MKIRRDANGPGPYLEWRVRLMGAGAIVALIGIWADATWLVNIAIGLLFVGFLLRFVGGRKGELEDFDAEDDLDEGADYDVGADHDLGVTHDGLATHDEDEEAVRGP